MPLRRYDFFSGNDLYPKPLKSSEETFAFGGKISRASRLLSYIPFGKKLLPDTNPAGECWAIDITRNATLVALGMGVAGGGSYLQRYRFNGDLISWLVPPSSGNPTGSVYDMSYHPHTSEYMAIAHENAPYITVFNTYGVFWGAVTAPSILPTGNGRGVSWSPDGKHLAVAHANSPYLTVYRFDNPITASPTFTKLTSPVTLPTGDAYCIEWSPDGKHLAVGHVNAPYITVYRFDGSTLTKVANPATSVGSAVRGLAWSPDGRYLSLALLGGTSWAIYNFENGSFGERASYGSGGSTNYDTIWSRDGRMVFFANSGGAVLANGFDGVRVTGGFFTSPGGTPIKLKLSEDGYFLAVAHTVAPYCSIYATATLGSLNPGPMLVLEQPSNAP